jgi:hypothetical protein
MNIVTLLQIRSETPPQTFLNIANIVNILHYSQLEITTENIKIYIYIYKFYEAT